MAWYDTARRITDGARDALRAVDEFGASWEGATMRDVRVEGAGPLGGSASPRITPAPRIGLGLPILIGLVLLLAWK